MKSVHSVWKFSDKTQPAAHSSRAPIMMFKNNLSSICVCSSIKISHAVTIRTDIIVVKEKKRKKNSYVDGITSVINRDLWPCVCPLLNDSLFKFSHSHYKFYQLQIRKKKNNNNNNEVSPQDSHYQSTLAKMEKMLWSIINKGPSRPRSSLYSSNSTLVIYYLFITCATRSQLTSVHEENFVRRVPAGSFRLYFWLRFIIVFVKRSLTHHFSAGKHLSALQTKNRLKKFTTKSSLYNKSVLVAIKNCILRSVN